MAAKIIKKVANCTLYEGHVLKIRGVRASYPHLAEAKAGDDGGTPSFSLTGLMPHGTHKEAALLIKEAIEALLKENKNAKVAKDKRCLRNGDDGDKEEAFGHYTISAREQKRPKVRDSEGELLEKDEVADMFYGGCWVDMIIRLWYQDNKYGKRVNANLVSAKFVRDDEAFGEGRINDEDVWDDDDDDNGGGFEDDDDDI